MTSVAFKYAKPTATGYKPLTGTLSFAPTRKRVIEGEPDTILLPVPFMVDIPETGVVSVNLDPTGPDWAWKVTAVITGASRTVETVLVPVNGPQDYPDLTRVDPDTLAPEAEPEPAWYAALEAAIDALPEPVPGAPGVPGKDSTVPGPPPSVEQVAFAVAADPTVRATAETVAEQTETLGGHATNIAANAKAIADNKHATVVRGCDGGAGDTAIVQAAMDLGGHIILPLLPFGQAYSLSKLIAKRGTTFECLPGVVIKRRGTSYGISNIVSAVNPLLDNNDPYSGHGDITIRGGTWDGNIIAEAYMSIGFNLFFFAGARGITIENVTVKDMVTNHCIDINGVDDVTIRKNRFVGYRDGTTPADSIYPRNYTEAIQYSQFIGAAFPEWAVMNGTPSKNIVIEKNYFGPSGTAGTTSWPTAFGNHTISNDPLPSNITLRVNIFDGCTYAGVVPYTFNDVKIINNTFIACNYGVRANNFTNGNKWDKATQTNTTGLATRMETSGMKIADNEFIDSVVCDISILGTGPDANGFWATCNDIHIHDNHLRATTAAKRSGQNIRLLLCKKGTIHDNECNNGATGILVDSCININTHDNYVYNTTGYGINLTKGTVLPGTDIKWAVGNRVVDNHVENAGSHGIGNNTQHFSTVEGNSVIDWGRVSATANGILSSGTDGSLVSDNNIRTQYTGLGAAIAVSSGTTANVAVTYTNRISKPDGALVTMGTIPSNTYGQLVYATS
jgi:hypothetical protein